MSGLEKARTIASKSTTKAPFELSESEKLKIFPFFYFLRKQTELRK